MKSWITKINSLFSQISERFYNSRPDHFSLADIQRRQKQRLKRLEGIAISPPPCGKYVCYRHQQSGLQDNQCVSVLFLASDIEHHFKGKQLPLYNPQEAQALVPWIKGRDEGTDKPTCIPEDINFENMAMELIDSGYGEIECLECKRKYAASELNRTVPPIHAGWNLATYYCPQDHTLLTYQYAHFNMKKNSVEKTNCHLCEPSNNNHHVIQKIISGGKTCVDRAPLDITLN